LSSSADPLTDLENMDHFMNHDFESKISRKFSGTDETDLEKKASLQMAKEQTGMLDWNI
jgi:hypothetical protein